MFDINEFHSILVARMHSHEHSFFTQSIKMYCPSLIGAFGDQFVGPCHPLLNLHLRITF